MRSGFCPSPRPVPDDFLAFQLPFLGYSLQILCVNKSELRSRWMSFFFSFLLLFFGSLVDDLFPLLSFGLGDFNSLSYIYY